MLAIDNYRVMNAFLFGMRSMSRKVLERIADLDHTCRLEGDSGGGQILIAFPDCPHDVAVVIILLYVDNTGVRSNCPTLVQ